MADLTPRITGATFMYLGPTILGAGKPLTSYGKLIVKVSARPSDGRARLLPSLKLGSRSGPPNTFTFDELEVNRLESSGEAFKYVVALQYGDVRPRTITVQPTCTFSLLASAPSSGQLQVVGETLIYDRCGAPVAVRLKVRNTAPTPSMLTRLSFDEWTKEKLESPSTASVAITVSNGPPNGLILPRQEASFDVAIALGSRFLAPELRREKYIAQRVYLATPGATSPFTHSDDHYMVKLRDFTGTLTGWSTVDIRSTCRYETTISE